MKWDNAWNTPMETKLEKQKVGCDIAVFTKNAYASEIQLNVAVKP